MDEESFLNYEMHEQEMEAEAEMEQRLQDELELMNELQDKER